MGDVAKTLVGVVVGGLIAVFGSIATVKYTTAQTAGAERRTALGASRLLVDDLRRAEGDLGNSLHACTYELYAESIELPTNDVIQLAWRFSPKDWLPVALAAAALKVQVGRSHTRHRFTHDDVVQIEYTIKQIDAAGSALKNVSGESLFTAQQVAKTLGSVGRRCRKA